MNTLWNGKAIEKTRFVADHMEKSFVHKRQPEDCDTHE